MTRVAFLLHIKANCEDEYVRRHKHLWPEVSEEMKKAGVRSMSIFLSGRQAILYMETEDYERVVQFLSRAPASQRWEHYMASIMEGETDAPTTRTTHGRKACRSCSTGFRRTCRVVVKGGLLTGPDVPHWEPLRGENEQASIPVLIA